jgi:NADH:ubiquinone oxidoreductase subunit D
LAWDLRRNISYEIYNDLDFKIPFGLSGDSYDRYLIRLIEMRQSISIITQCLEGLPCGEIRIDDYRVTPPFRANMKFQMESMIAHFKHYSEGLILDGATYTRTEAPKGEFGIYLSYTNSNVPSRMRLRSPGFFHLEGLNRMVANHYLADLVTIIGTQDLVFGDIDR